MKLSESFVKTKGFNATDTDGNKDCALRAISLAFNTEYDYVYYKLADYGRKDGRGTYRHHSIKLIQEIADLLNIKVTIFDMEKLNIRIRVDEFLKTYNTGRYICYVPRHVFTVIDGKRHDTYIANELVLLGIKLDGDFTKRIEYAKPVVNDLEFHFD